MKHLEMEFGSIGEMITMLRYNDILTVADLQRPVKVTMDIDTESPLDGTYLHIAGPISPKWLSTQPQNNVKTGGEIGKAAKPHTKRVIGFKQPDVQTETQSQPENESETTSSKKQNP